MPFPTGNSSIDMVVTRLLRSDYSFKHLEISCGGDSITANLQAFTRVTLVSSAQGRLHPQNKDWPSPSADWRYLVWVPYKLDWEWSNGIEFKKNDQVKRFCLPFRKEMWEDIWCVFKHVKQNFINGENS